MRPNVPATPIMTSVMTMPARMVRFRDEKNAAIVASCFRSVRRAKSLSRLPERLRRSAALQVAAVRRHRVAEREIDQAGEQVSLDAESRPYRVLQGDLDGTEEIEQPNDEDE